MDSALIKAESFLRGTGMKQKKMRSNRIYNAYSIITVVAFLAIWEVLVLVGLGGIIPAPSTIFGTFIKKLTDLKPDGSTLLTNVVVSLQVASTGLFLAIFIGVPL